MSEKRAGGILASSFVAGLLLAAAIFSPRAWDPVPGPYFGLEDQTTTKSHSADGMEAAHAELSARAQARMSAGAFAPVAALVADPVAAPLDSPPAAPAVAVAPIDTGLMPTDAESVTLDVAPAVIPSVVLPIAMAEQAAPPPAEPLTPVAVPFGNVGRPPQRIAMGDTSSPAATAALAATLPPSTPTPTAAQPSQQVEPPASLKAMMTRMQAAQPPVSQPPVSQPPQQIAEQPPQPVPPSAPPQNWSQAFAAAPAVVPAATRSRPDGSGCAGALISGLFSCASGRP